MRGEYFDRLISLSGNEGSPPLAWGIPKAAAVLSPTIKDHPHLRGEYLLRPFLSLLKKGSPPLAWGILTCSGVYKTNVRITPTCVGNTTSKGQFVGAEMDHPHLRGEYYTYLRARIGRPGSPPLAWGIQ